MTYTIYSPVQGTVSWRTIRINYVGLIVRNSAKVRPKTGQMFPR